MSQSTGKPQGWHKALLFVGSVVTLSYVLLAYMKESPQQLHITKETTSEETLLERVLQICYSQSTAAVQEEILQLDNYIVCIYQERLKVSKLPDTAGQVMRDVMDSPTYATRASIYSQLRFPDSVQNSATNESSGTDNKLSVGTDDSLHISDAQNSNPPIVDLPSGRQFQNFGNERDNKTLKNLTALDSHANAADQIKIVDIQNIDVRFTEAQKRLATIDRKKLAKVGYPGVAIHRHSWSYPINIGQCDGNEMNFLILVPSAPKNFAARDIVRQTWGSPAEMTRLHSKTVFVVGLTSDMEVQKKIQEEYTLQHDIVQLDMYDAYYNLTLKTLGMLQWAATHCKTAKYVAKIDDDNMVHLSNILVAANKARQSHERFILGSYRPNGHPASGGKWADPVYEPVYKQGRHYPPFLGGPAYFMTNNFLEVLVTTCSQLPFIHLEDVFVTGICAQRVPGLIKLKLNGMSMQKISACSFVKPGVTVAHNYELADLKPTWDAWHTGHCQTG